VRAQLEKRGLMDVLRNQIIERKVLEMVQAEAKFTDDPYEPPKTDAEAISFAAGGGTGSSIPVISEAKEEVEEE
jgi:trigger factor